MSAELTCEVCGSVAVTMAEETEVLEEYADGHVDVPGHPTRPPMNPPRGLIAGPTLRRYEPCGHEVFV